MATKPKPIRAVMEAASNEGFVVCPVVTDMLVARMSIYQKRLMSHCPSGSLKSSSFRSSW